MSNSSLISGECLNLACSNPRGSNKIRKLTIHHMAGVATAMDCAKMHKNMGGVSANYYVGNAGEIVLGVPEDRRAWTSGSRENDYVAVTLEVSNSKAADPWPVSAAAYESMLNLCADICRRNNLKMVWTGDSSGTLTCHYMFDATICPGPYLTERMAAIAAEINRRAGIAPAPDPKPTPTVTDYTTVKGDTLTKIAAKFGTTVAELEGLNPDLLKPGTVIKVPATIKVGSVVKVKPGAVYYDGTKPGAAWVYTTKFSVLRISGDRVVVGLHDEVTGAFHAGDLEVVG